MTLFFTIVMLLLLIYAMAGLFIFRTACCRGKELDWNNPEAVRKSAYKRFVDILPMARQWLSEHSAQDVSILSHDDLRLHGWWIPVENPRGTLIMFHGYKGSYLVDCAPVYELFHKKGFNVLITEQRSHGRSEGKYITFGVKECRDAAGWIDFHNRNFGQLPVFLCGLSMGASTVLFAAGNPLPANVRGITADCGFTSPYEIIRHVAARTLGPAAALFMPMVNFWARQLALFDLKECSTRKSLARCPVPILLCHGLADNFVPSAMSQASFDACTAEKELYLIEGAAHGTSYLKDRERMETAYINFVERNLPKN